MSGGLCIQDPVIHEIFPTFGPKSGNTMLTIRGAFLDTGSRREVTIGKAACKIQRSVAFLSVLFFLFCNISCPGPLHSRKSLHIKHLPSFFPFLERNLEGCTVHTVEELFAHTYSSVPWHCCNFTGTNSAWRIC